MKKTLLVTLDFYPNIGGVAHYWQSLGNHLDPQKWVVLAPVLPSGVVEISTPYRMYRRRAAHWIYLLFTIVDIIRKENIEQIVVGQILPVGTVVLILHWVFGIPYIVSTHGMDVTLPARHARKRMLCKLILRNASQVITVSEYTKTELQKLGARPDSIQFVRPCPGLTPAHLEPHPELSPKKQRIILTAARLVRRKGHSFVLQALAPLFVDMPDLLYVIIGEGPQRVELEELTRSLGIEKNVLFLGKISSSQLAWWYSVCELFIMTPTEYDGDVEGFGMVYLEANSFGKPVIGSRSGGVPDAVVEGETGLLVKPEDVEQIRQAVSLLLLDVDQAKIMGEKGKSRVEKEFNWNHQASIVTRILS